MIDFVSMGLEKHVQQVIVQGLKDFYATRTDYTYSADPAVSDINIMGTYALRSVKYPCVILGHVAGDALVRTIGSQNWDVIRGDRVLGGMTIPNCVCGYVRGGGHKISVPITILALSTGEARVLKDYTVAFLSVIGRSYLESKNITITDIQLAGNDTVTLANNIITKMTITVSMYTEWREHIYDVPLIGDIYLGTTSIIL